MSKSLTFSFLVTGSLLVVLSLASVALANHAWSKYHWNLSTAETTVNPLKIGDNLTTTAWKQSLASSSIVWNNSVLKNSVVDGTSDANCNPTLGQIEVCNGSYGDNGWLGIAQVWAYRGKDQHIAQAVTMLNDTYFNTPTYNTSAWRNMVMCQEVGHNFGLAHQDENFSNLNLGSCMDYTSDPTGTFGTNGTLNNEWPNQHDYDMLKQIYAHVNETSTGGTKPGKGGSRGATPSNTVLEPAEWGQAVAQDAQGKNSLYVRNLDNGMQLITHVLWVPGEGEPDHGHQ
jgi:hypothetical protein